MPPHGSPTDAADSVTLSYPEDLSAWGRSKVSTSAFRAYLRRAHDAASEGDEWDEFVGTGCCGDSLDVPLVVESVEGGSQIGPDTAFVFEVREAAGVAGNWRVQSAGGPRQ